MGTAPLNERGGVARKRRPTAHDVAQAAGVSQSAVSRCFTPGASASPAVRKKVVEAAKRLGYRPNAMARTIITRRSGLVAIVVAVDTNLQYPEALSELSRALSRSGRRIMLFAIDTMNEVDAVVDQIWSYQVDGVVALVSLTDTQIGLLEDHDVPVVLYNRLPGKRLVSSVTCDHAMCGQLLAGHLIDAGHRRFALIHGPAHSSVASERMGGVAATLAAAGIGDILEARGDYTYDSGVAATRELGGQGSLLGSAIVAANDMMALGALDEARFGFDLSVPGETVVAGFDGIGAARWRSYDLTTVRQPLQRMAEAAAAMIAERVNLGLVGERRVFPGELVVGATAPD